MAVIKENPLMKPLRAVIVDDEPMARQALSRMLAEFPSILICGQADSVESAGALIDKVGADVVYLDIELIGRKADSTWFPCSTNTCPLFSSPPLTSMPFELLRSMRSTTCSSPSPGSGCRRRSAGSLTARPPLPDPVRLGIDDVILVHVNKRRRWLPIARVCLIEANVDFTVIRSIDGLQGIVWRSMVEWERILPEEQFVRIHRARIVNLDHVETFEKLKGNRLRLSLTGVPEPCHSSRRFTPTLRKRLMDLSLSQAWTRQTRRPYRFK